MDNTDVLSDSSESLRNSECTLSNTSSMSSLSGYQTEFLELRQLINTKQIAVESKPDSTDPKRNAVINFYDDLVQNLNAQLQNSLKQNEKFKNAIYNLEKKVDLSCNEKIEKLLRHNSQLEANLKAANNQIQRLINIYSSKSNPSEFTVLRDKILDLEKSNHDLHLRNFLLSNELNQRTYEKGNAENENKKLTTEINELKLELSAKVKCVEELKTKIAEQHMELQNTLQNNVKLSHTVESVSNELQYVMKSENWYKNELHHLQEEKRYLTDNIAEKNKTITSQETVLEQLKLELNKWKCTCDEVRLTSLKEKENILKQVEIANSQMTNTKSSDLRNCHVSTDVQRITDCYEITIQELTGDVTRIKQGFANQQNALEKLTKENSDLLEKYLSIQNCLKEKECALEKLENIKRDLKLKLGLAMDKEQDYNMKLLRLKKLASDFEVELTMKKREKENIEESIKAIKEQFKLFKNKYDCLNEELQTKNKEILQLKFEKQELHMTNNLKTCELEKLQQKTVDIFNLQEKIAHMTQTENELKFENCRLIEQVEHVKQKNKELQKKNDELETGHSNMNKQIVKSDKAVMTDKENVVFNADNNLKVDNTKSVENAVNSEENKNQLTSKEKSIANNAKEKILSNFIINNYVNLRLDDVNIVDILEYICKLCQIADCINASTVRCNIADDNKFEYIKILLTRIENYFQHVNTEIKDKNERLVRLGKKMCKLRKGVVKQTEILEDRCKELHNKTEENAKLLSNLLNEHSNDKNCDKNVEIKHLQVLLQVKIREQQDRQKRYETNYRTLLRKVKEHMKGRNLAEKHNVHLQEMYNSLHDECNTLRLQIDLRNSEALKLQDSNEKYLKKNEQLKSELLDLQKITSVSNHCERCIQLFERNEELEKSLKDVENRSLLTSNELQLKKELVDQHQKENQELLFKLSVMHTDRNSSVSKIETLIGDNKQLSAKLNNLENMLLQEISSNENLKIKLVEEKENCMNVCAEKDQLIKEIEATAEKNSYLLKEIEHLNSRLQLKAEELKELQLQKEQLRNSYATKDIDVQNIITAFKVQLQTCRNEMDTTYHEKFFLQRLCNDLKVALKIHVNHNKVLKEYLNTVSKESKDKCISLSAVLSNFPSPTRYDDGYINKLLQENKAPLQDKPLSDLQVCLDALRKEIVVLQKQIIETNPID